LKLDLPPMLLLLWRCALFTVGPAVEGLKGRMFACGGAPKTTCVSTGDGSSEKTVTTQWA
jgi:hypothetical protein